MLKRIGKVIDRWEISRFIVVGGTATIIDAIVYFSLIFLGLLDPGTAKRLGFLIASTFAFYFNRKYVFNVKNKRFIHYFSFSAVYISSYLANGYGHDFVLKLFNFPIFAFLFAAAISTTMNFFGQKYIVFKK